MEDVHEPLVSAELWQRAQDEIDRRSRMGGLARPTNRYLLSGLIKCTACGCNYVGRKGSTRGYQRYYYDSTYMRHGRAGCEPMNVNAADMDAFVMDEVRAVLFGDEPAVVKAVDQFVKAMRAKTKPDERRGRIEADLKLVNKRIASAVALLSDGDLDDLAELRETLLNLRTRRAALEAELTAATTKTAIPMDADTLRKWALNRLAEIDARLNAANANLTTGNAPDDIRRTVQDYVIRIDIDPTARRGKLILPADAVTVLERDINSSSRVKPGDAGFTAMKTAFLTSSLIALKILDKVNGQGPDGDFAITSFSRNEALEEAIKVNVTAKLAVFRAWLEGTGT
jgi:hypothetical protein